MCSCRFCKALFFASRGYWWAIIASIFFLRKITFRKKRESKHRALTYIFHDQTSGIATWSWWFTIITKHPICHGRKLNNHRRRENPSSVAYCWWFKHLGDITSSGWCWISHDLPATYKSFPMTGLRRLGGNTHGAPQSRDKHQQTQWTNGWEESWDKQQVNQSSFMIMIQNCKHTAVYLLW